MCHKASPFPRVGCKEKRSISPTLIGPFFVLHYFILPLHIPPPSFDWAASKNLLNQEVVSLWLAVRQDLIPSLNLFLKSGGLRTTPVASESSRAWSRRSWTSSTQRERSWEVSFPFFVRRAFSKLVGVSDTLRPRSTSHSRCGTIYWLTLKAEVV